MRPNRFVIPMAVAFLGATLLPGLAWARPPARAAAAAGHTKSAAGTYTYYDDAGDGPETLTLYSNGISDFGGSVGDCNGSWVQSGKLISIDIFNNCGIWIFSGTVGPQGLSSASRPGHSVTHESTSNFPGTWYAVNGAAAGSALGRPTLSHRPLASSVEPKSKAGGTYNFFEDKAPEGSMVLATNGNFSTTFPDGRTCYGLWVQSGKGVAMDWTLPNCVPSIMVGMVKSKSLSSKKKSGVLDIASGDFHQWYATKKK